MGTGSAVGDRVAEGLTDGLRGGLTEGVVGKDIEVRSPDGGILFLFRCKKGVPEYDVRYRGLPLIERSPLSLRFSDHSRTYPFGAFVEPGVAVVTEGTDDYTLVVGKANAVHDRYRQAVIPLIEPPLKGRMVDSAGNWRKIDVNIPGRKIDLVVRVFNDGLAFRWVIHKQEGWTSFKLLDEASTFRVVGDPNIMASFREGFTTSHEGLYWKGRFSQIKEDTLMDMPIFLDFGGDLCGDHGGAAGGLCGDVSDPAWGCVEE